MKRIALLAFAVIIISAGVAGAQEGRGGAIDWRVTLAVALQPPLNGTIDRHACLHRHAECL